MESVASLCHPWFTTTNLSYRFPIFETSATALCGTTGVYIYIYISISKDSPAMNRNGHFDAALLMPHFWKKTVGLESCSRAVAFSTDCIFSTKYCILEMKTAPCKEGNASCKARGLLFKEYCISQIEAASLNKAALFQNQTCFKETLHMRMKRNMAMAYFQDTLHFSAWDAASLLEANTCCRITALTMYWARDILQF